MIYSETVRRSNSSVCDEKMIPLYYTAAENKGENNMKKIISILMILMLCSACICAAAEENGPLNEELPEAGLVFTYPKAMTEAEGIIETDGAIQLSDGLYYTYWYYCGATQEEYEAILNGDPEAPENRAALLFYVFSVGDNRDFSAITEYANDLSPENAITIGKAEDWTFYLYMTYDPDFPSCLEKKYADEYTALCGMEDEIAAAFAYSAPVDEDTALAGRKIEFETTDLDGNPVSSGELFGQHEITMVNVWATWCGPCVGELAELEALYTRLLGKDCAVVGMLTDQDLEEAKRLIADNGITYPVILAPDDLIVSCPAIPTSFFVDRNGIYQGKRIVGAMPDEYEPAVDKLLDSLKQANP